MIRLSIKNTSINPEAFAFGPTNIKSVFHFTQLSAREVGHVLKGQSPITGIVFQTNDVRLRGGGGGGRSLFVWKKNWHFWTAACGFARLPGRLGDEEIHKITNFAQREAFMSKPEFVDVFCRADSQTS